MHKVKKLLIFILLVFIVIFLIDRFLLKHTLYSNIYLNIAGCVPNGGNGSYFHNDTCCPGLQVRMLTAGESKNAGRFTCEKSSSVKSVTDESFCSKDEDCVITSYTYDCCGAPCGGAIINRQSFEKRKQWTIDNCNPADYIECPQVNCMDIEEKAVCDNNKCVRKLLN